LSHSNTAKTVNPTDDNVNKILEASEEDLISDRLWKKPEIDVNDTNIGDIKIKVSTVWKDKIQSANSFDDIYAAFKDAGLFNWEMPRIPEDVRKVFDTVDRIRPVLPFVFVFAEKTILFFLLESIRALHFLLQVNHFQPSHR
jgi:hypothetical protein